MKNRITIIILLVISLSSIGMIWYFSKKQKDQIHQIVEQKTKISAQTNPYQDVQITTSIILSENNTFGYDIYVDSVKLIHQPSKPGMSGNEGFSNKEHAQQVANLVVKKIRNNEMPPTVTLEELEFIIYKNE